jgi:CubicO group peptidase (beta-lactamase class C family)
MGQRANLIIVREQAYELYYSHWCANTLPEVLFWGPEHALSFIERQTRVDESGPGWLDEVWAEGGALLDLEKRKLLFYGGEDILLDVPLRNLFLRLMEKIWPGWEIIWAYEGILDLATYVGYPQETLLAEREVYTCDRSLAPPPARDWTDLIASVQFAGDDLLLFPLDGQLDSYLFNGPALINGINKSYGYRSFVLSEWTEVFPAAGFHIDVTRKRIDIWHAKALEAVLTRLQSIWPGWEIIDHGGGYEAQVKRTGGALKLQTADEHHLLDRLQHMLLENSAANPVKAVTYFARKEAEAGKAVEINPYALKYDTYRLPGELKAELWNAAVSRLSLNKSPLLKGLPEDHNLSSRNLLDFFSQIEQSELAVNSFMLLQDGVVTAESARAPYRLDQPQLLYSLSKSFTSIAVGIAVDEGLLQLEDSVISFFPDKLPDAVSSNLAKMTVHHLLSMTAGHHDNIYGAVAQEEDWVRAFLAQEVPHEPGSHYVYSTHSTYMLSAIIERVSGQSLTGFLQPRLFEPLAIPRPVWETCPLGITAGGMGLSLSTESIAKFGQLLLNKGEYNGNRIVSEHYLALAVREQSDNRLSAPIDRIDSAQGYGYQFHLCRRGCYRGDGSFGQLCLVAPGENIVIAATAAFGSMQQLQTLLDLIYEYIIDRLGGQEADSEADNLELQGKLAAWTYPFPLDQPGSSPLISLDDRSYRLGHNPHGLREIRLEKQKDRLTVQLSYGDERDNGLPFSLTERLYAQDVFHKDLSLHLQEVVTSAAWQDRHTLKLTLLYIETPYIVTYTIGFREQEIDLEFQINVSLNIPQYSTTGRMITGEG